MTGQDWNQDPNSVERGRWFAPGLVLVAGLLTWEFWVRLADTPDWLLPPPSAVAGSLVNDWRLLVHHGWVTLQEVIAGFAVALIAGALLAAGLDASPVLKRITYPLIVASQAIPIVALAPLLLVWFGYGVMPKIIVTGLVAFFPIVVATYDGLRSTDSECLELLRSMGAGRWARFRLIKVPSALPALFSGARIGVAVSVIGAVFGEYVGAKAGLGYLMNISSGRLLTDRVFACIFLLAVMAIGLFGFVSWLEQRLLPWRKAQVGGKSGQ